MYEQQANRFRSIGPMLSRCFWVLMALTHASAMVGAWNACMSGGASTEGLGGCVALTLSMVFFALKLGGVSFLRFRTGARAWVAICLVVTLTHIDCVRPDREGTFASDCTALLATTALVGGLTRLPESFRRALDGRERSIGFPAPRWRSSGVVWLHGCRPNSWLFSSHLFHLRAPPRGV